MHKLIQQLDKSIPLGIDVVWHYEKCEFEMKMMMTLIGDDQYKITIKLMVIDKYQFVQGGVVVLVFEDCEKEGVGRECICNQGGFPQYPSK